MKCFELNDLGCPIRLTQEGIDNFTLVRGVSVQANLSYSQAATALGEAIMYELARVGRLDDRERGEDEVLEGPADGPDEDALTTTDGVNFYQYGELVLTVPEGQDRDAALRAFMDREKFWVDAWSISDHGNAHRIDLGDEETPP